MATNGCTVGGSELTAEATLFYQAQGGCARSLNHLLRRHEGRVQAVVRGQALGGLSFAEA